MPAECYASSRFADLSKSASLYSRPLTEMTEATDIETELDPAEVSEKVAEGAQLIDVRQDYEWDAGHIDGAVHIPLEQLPARTETFDRDHPVVFQCRTGSRSAFATQI